MADKYILLANRAIPIQMDAPVYLYSDGKSPSFYNPATTLSPASLAQMQMRRPDLRNFSFRHAGRGFWFKNEVSRLNDVNPEELQLLGETIIQIAIHHDVTLDAVRTFDVLCSRGLSTHFVINHNGALYQFLDIYHNAWATGDNNNRCIAIDMNNPVLLELAGADPANPPRQVQKGRVNGSVKVMLAYTEAQYATLIALMRALVTPIRQPDGSHWIPFPRISQHCFPPINENGEVVDRLLRNHLDYVGFLGHYHCSANKWDPGPAFDWLRVLAGIYGERNSFPVLLPGGKNLTDLTGAALKDQLEAYYQNIESNEEGGWYPIGANQSWHSGVHVHVDEGTPVFAMSKGTIVAIRNSQRVDLGDPNFVLIRHEAPQDTTEPSGDSDEPRYWFSLYMHLRRLEATDFHDIVWVQKVLDGVLEPPEDDSFSFAYAAHDFPREKRPPRTADATNPVKFMAESKGKPFHDGDIILTNIPVSAGEHIGYAGVFGSSEWNLEAQVHIEAISEHNLFARTSPGRSSDWIIVEGDLADNSLVEIETILRPIMRTRSPYEKGSRILKTSEIRSFFVDGSAEVERALFRKMICYHRSEWSPGLDWTRTATNAVGWQWETQEAFGRWLLTWVPFQWMTKELSAYLDFPKNHAFYTYHPFHLLEQLNISYSGALDATAEGASLQEMTADTAEKEERLGRLTELMQKMAHGEKLTDEEAIEYDELYALMDDHLDSGEADVGRDDYTFDYDGSFDKWEPGEWDPPKRSNEPY